MHPVNFLFEEIYRDHWGIPHPKEPVRERRIVPAWRRRQLRRNDARN